MRRIALPLICVLLLAATAGRGGAAESEATRAANGIVDVELPAFFVPITVNARLENYAFITVSLTPTGADKVLTIREKVPFLRDAFLRELTKGTIIKAGDPTALDTPSVEARLMARAKAVLPADTVSGLKLEQAVITPVEPGS